MRSDRLIAIDTDAHGVRAVFSTRIGGVSTGAHASLNIGATTGDDPALVRSNRRSLAEDAGFDAARAATMCQVHGARVLDVDPVGGAGGYLALVDGVGEADSLVTSSPGVALAALGADCLPVLVWDREGRTVAAAHAGWRGLVAGVLEATVARVGDPSRIAAAVGPGIGPCCYAVDGALRDVMISRFGAGVVAGTAVNLAAAARAALQASGIPGTAVSVVECCTSCDERRFFSYRRDGAGTGRHGGVVWREEEGERE